MSMPAYNMGEWIALHRHYKTTVFAFKMALDSYYMLYCHFSLRNAHESSHASLCSHTNDAKHDARSSPNDATYAMYGFLYQPIP